MQQPEIGSILAIDIGTSRTKAALFDVVEGQHRFVARSEVLTTLYFPVEDVSAGVKQVIARIEEICGRSLMGPEGPMLPQRKNGSGVDFFVTTTSLGGRLRLLLASPTKALASLQQTRAILDARGVESEVVVLSELPSASETRYAAVVGTLKRFRPHAIFVLGEADQNSSLQNLAQDLVASVHHREAESVPVYFIGTSEASESFQKLVGSKFDFYATGAPDDSNPSTAVRLENEVASLWQQCIVEEIPGYSLIASWQGTPVEHTSFAWGNSLRFISKHLQTEVIGIDIGASSISIPYAANGAGEMRLGLTSGIGQNAINVLDDAAQIRRRLPFEATDDEIENAVLNKWARPWTVPETFGEMLFESALSAASAARLRGETNAYSSYFRASSGLGLVVGAGALIANQSSPGIMALTLLDALEPVGAFEIAIDKDSLLAQLGAVARHYPQAAAEALLTDALQYLGTCIACAGNGRAGSKAVTIQIKRGAEKPRKIEVPYGEISAIPLASEETAEVVVKPSGGFDCGWGKGKSGKLAAKGGRLGLIIDARGRPVAPPSPNGKGHERIRRWLDSVGHSMEHTEAR